MSEAMIGKWGKNLAIRVPAEIAKATGLREGERVEISTRDGDIVIRRPAERARADAAAAAEEIIAKSRRYRLDAAEIRALIEEGRRG